MTTIYSINSSDSKAVLEPVWDENSKLDDGYSSMRSLHIGKNVILVAYDKSKQKTDTFRLLDKDPWIEKTDSKIDLSDYDWDLMEPFVLGNNTFLMMYQAKFGIFGFYQIHDDLTSSNPYKFSNSRLTPTQGFSTIAPFEVFGQQYFLGYSNESGKVASFSLSVKTKSWNSPPLRAQNVWYHQWSPGWTNFAFFQLGEANFFFKINENRLNVNIDHIIDNPAEGGIPIGSHLEKVLPKAEIISSVTKLPWNNGEPVLLTHINKENVTTIYRINGDCRSFTNLGETTTKKASIIVPYQIGKNIFALYYGGKDE